MEGAHRIGKFAGVRFAIAAVFALLAFAHPASAQAARLPWSAAEALRSGKSFDLAPGDSATFTIKFKNNGAKTWVNDGKNYLSVYTAAPSYRKSPFLDLAWQGETQPVRLAEPKVAPGQVGTFSFSLYAPDKPGSYHESFQLAAEDLKWIPGGRFAVDVTVKDVPRTNIYGESYASGFRALMLLVSDRKLTMDAGETKDFRVGFKNVGRTTWKKDGAASVVLKATGSGSFKSSGWSGDAVVTPLTGDEVKPGQLALFSFTMTAPNSGGVFRPRFVLATDGGIVDGGEIEIPIEVRQSQVPSEVSPLLQSEYAAAGPRGPLMRIGLFNTLDRVVIAAAGSYALVEGMNHTKVRELSGITTIDFDFAGRMYTVRNGDFTFTSDHHVHFWPDDPTSTIFEIQSYENRPSWDPTVNFNKFRGNLEMFYSRATDKLWVIEELPLEDYMRGLGETSNGSAYEFQKALVTAARTYALFVKSIGGKHKTEYFDLNTGGNDQVYKGYASELVRPNVARAVEETRGQVVTYQNEIVVTPYFSRSDGRTRSWTEVWSSVEHPWLVSKTAPYDVGKTLWGHGVGMSASDAVGRANAGASWTDILKYYYTGIEIRQLY